MAAVSASAVRRHGLEPVRNFDSPSFEEISAYHLIDETRLAGGLIERAIYTDEERRRTFEIAAQLVHRARADRHKHPGIDAFMEEYGLSSEEGVILMCIAEALLRIPDRETADQLIAEKLGEGAWGKHFGHSDSMFVNASTWGLMLTGRIVKLKNASGSDPVSAIKRMVARSGEPVIRQAVRKAVGILGNQFVLGTDIRKALARASTMEDEGYTFSYDLLGESARSDKDAVANFERYLDAVDAIGRSCGPLMTEHPDALMRRPSLSIKLSSLHPRFEPGKDARLRHELLPRLLELLRTAREQGIAITIDAEEQDRLEPTLLMFADGYRDPALDGWHGLGIAVQAYGKRAIPALRWLRRLAERGGRRIPVRLVKGAYWDSEIKWAQERALEDYPVFTKKLYTDLSYLACMHLLLSDQRAFYPQFATHNAYSLAAGYVAGGSRLFEFQRLHGMSEALYDSVVGESELACPCRIYAPVGGHEHLLSFLVRRILENGANTSFVNRLADDEAPVSEIVRDPVEWAEKMRAGERAALEGSYGVEGERPPIVAPRAIFKPSRIAAAGLALTNASTREALLGDIRTAIETPFAAGPIVSGEATTGTEAGARLALCPHDRAERFGTVCDANAQHLETAIATATARAHSWEQTPAQERAALLEKAAELFERDRARLIAAMMLEGGQILQTAHDEVRTAVDFLRFYAGEARHLFGRPMHLTSATGETNRHGLRGRGPFACISPFCSPLSVFTGQVAAALAAGNPVLAKPSEHTPMVAFVAVELLLEAGVPTDVLHLLTGDGAIGLALVRDTRIAGVAFTGTTKTAWSIQKTLAERRSAIVPFIAATSGLNTMIADSSALPEHVVSDCVRSAFGASGLRCSASRVLIVQDEIASRTIEMLSGAILDLDIGDPFSIATDIGPVINIVAQDRLDAHKLKMQRQARALADCVLPERCRRGSYVTPAAYEIDSLDDIGGEVFGPILHIVRYERGALPDVIEHINASGFGMTMCLHSRIGAVADYVGEHARVGNLYINRDQVRPAVGVQPFGGEGLSGTGPHAGGANYVARFANERVRSSDITATGGNLDLLRPVAKGR